MTREEYENLLTSDYWKGYSYSLIKERNFTCEDCGQRFYNERNKLQVHHLVYRDTNPWSYKPEELVVLCERCHKKRHGIWSEPEQETPNVYTQNIIENYAKSYSYSTNSHTYNEDSEHHKPHINNNNNGAKQYPDKRSFYNPQKTKFRYYLYGILLFVVLLLGINKLFKQVSTNNKKHTEIIIETSSIKDDAETLLPIVNPIINHHASSNNDIINDTKEYIEENETTTEISEQSKIAVEEECIESNENFNAPQNNDNKKELSTSEILDRIHHTNVVEQAKRAGVSTEGTTSEILDRIHRANVVEQAKRAGVSTEGTTSEILDRIHHTNVVEQAKRAGVSTEGTTSEILDRIHRANVVEQAKRAGVSTEGTTSEILNRIHHANVVEQAKRNGVKY